MYLKINVVLILKVFDIKIQSFRLEGKSKETQI